MHRLRDDEVPQDWAALADWFAARGSRLDLETSPPRQFSGGLANLNYELIVDGQPVVLRRPPSGPLAKGGNDMAREHRVLRHLAPVYPLAPKPVGFCDDSAVLGAAFQLLERRVGASVTSGRPEWIADDDAEGAARLTQSVIDALVELHDLDPVAIGLGDLGRPPGFLERQVTGWSRRAHVAWNGTPPPLVDELMRRLLRGMPREHPPALLHLDWKFDNLLFDPENLCPTAVLDWDMSTRGDPHVDLGVMLAYWIQPGDPEALHVLGQSPALAPGFPDRDGLVSTYAEQHDVWPETLAACTTFGRLRLAVVFQQLARLAAVGAVRDPRYDGFSDVAVQVLEWAAEADRELG